MFGYVMPDRKELKIKDWETYQSYYCGLCRILKKNYHFYGALSLNYDMTFLGVFLSGLYEPESSRRVHRCMLHGGQKRYELHNVCLEYAADMNILLAYYKCLDDWRDEHHVLRAGYAGILGHSFRKIRQRYPQKVEKVQAALEKLAQLEKAGSTDLDQLSGCFGTVCAELFLYDAQWEELLYRFGCYLGKYIYLLDACDDLEEDWKKGRFNPLLSYRGREDFEGWLYELLNMTIAQACRSFEKLPIIENVDILRNILYAGVWQKYALLREKKRDERLPAAQQKRRSYDGSI